MSSSVVLKALGLNVSPNQIELPNGSLSQATDVVIRRGDILEPRRGFYLYGNSLGTSTDVASQLFTYKNRILRQFNETMQFDADGAGTFESFDGTFIQAQTGLRTKSIESNGNFYFTSLNGIQLISAATNANFTTAPGYIIPAGVPKAIDLTAVPIPPPEGAIGFLPQDSTVAYKTTWATNDVNANLKIGSPSQAVAVYLPLLSLLIPDILQTLEALNNIELNPTASFFSSGFNYVNTFKLPLTASSSEVGVTLIELATQIDNDIIYANDTGTGSVPLTISEAKSYATNTVRITFSAGNPSFYFSPTQTDRAIFLTGFGLGTLSNLSINGAESIVAVTSTTLTFNLTGATNTETFLITGSSIVSNIYRSIALPSTQDSPPTADELASLQTYLSNIIAGLQAENGNYAFTVTSANATAGATYTNNGQTFIVASTISAGTTLILTPTTVTPYPTTSGTLTKTSGSGDATITFSANAPPVISAPNQAEYITPLTITGSANVLLTIDIPEAVTSNDFLQIYRSVTVTATGVDVLNDLVANGEETQLVYEAYPTAAELAAGQMVVTDITPDIFKGANLYTNASTGEGILQANDIPPFALDINRFKNVIFYANTRTRHRITPFSLIGVSNMITDAENSIIPTITIANTLGVSNTYKFVLGVENVTLLDVIQKSLIVNGSYFFINSADNANEYFVWADKTGTSLTPNYTFTVSSANATTGATYTNNGNLYTVINTISAGTTLITNGSSAPLTSGTLTKISGTGDATITFSAVQDLTLLTGIRVDISSSGISTSLQVAQRYSDVLSGYVGDFTVVIGANSGDPQQISITNNAVGFTIPASVQNSGFTISTAVSGSGESIANKEVLLSTNISPAIAVDETARSLVKVINHNSNELVYAYYTSTLGQVPGQMVLEARTLTPTPFYIIANDKNTGTSFVPNLTPAQTNFGAGIISVANPTVITSATSLSSQGLVNNSQIIITGSNSTPSINGIYTITVTGTNTFTIPVNVTVAGTTISYTNLTTANISQNEVKPNRIYYSKLLQPESVPIVNFLEVGAADKAILRIFPLRDSLFVLKEDGLFRISGEVIPFYLSLFDTSCICISADSVAIANNLIYAYTRQGISTISEAGVSTPPASRPIDIEILKVASASFTNFQTSTWGIGYESDNSYTVFTVQKTTDTQATIGYRYSNLTNTWTTINKNSVCGIINSFDDKMYLGAGDTNFIELERKNFDRTDYADRELSSAIGNGLYIGNNIQLPTVTEYAIGDVVLQTQNVTVYKYNNLLKKLDVDPTLAAVNISAISGSLDVLTITATAHNLVTGNYVTILNNTSVPSINNTYLATKIDNNNFQITISSPLTTTSINGQARLNYFNSLQISGGVNLRTALTNLTAKLDTDPGASLTNYSALIANLTGSITNIAVGNSGTITSAANGLLTGRYVTIGGSNSVPIIDGNWIITRLTANTFTIPTSVNTAGNTGTFTTDITNFQDILGCYNIIIDNLNADSGITFHNYIHITDTTTIETNIVSINNTSKQITLDAPLNFVVGPITIYKAITSTVVYSPNTLGDPLGFKHMQEASIMFSNKAFTAATISFSSDLLPAFLDVPFLGAGNGIFGSGAFGQSFFGGLANAAPVRTYYPRNVQRCRFTVVKFTHSIARESYAIYGITLSGTIGISTRAYR